MVNSAVTKKADPAMSSPDGGKVLRQLHPCLLCKGQQGLWITYAALLEISLTVLCEVPTGPWHSVDFPQHGPVSTSWATAAAVLTGKSKAQYHSSLCCLPLCFWTSQLQSQGDTVKLRVSNFSAAIRAQYLVRNENIRTPSVEDKNLFT